MPIPTELVGSLPRPLELQAAYEDLDQGKITFEELQAKQRESSFATYPITDTLAGTGLADNLAGDGQFFAIFDDGHHRQLPRLTGGPFRYKTFASEFVQKNQAIATKPVKQAVISPSMMMLLYPLDEEVDGYPREQFLDDVCDEVEKDIRRRESFLFASRPSVKSIDTRSAPASKHLPHVRPQRGLQPAEPRGRERGGGEGPPRDGGQVHPVERLGATDDCGFSPFSRDLKPKHGPPDFARDIAMQKISARVEGTRMASEELGV